MKKVLAFIANDHNAAVERRSVLLHTLTDACMNYFNEIVEDAELSETLQVLKCLMNTMRLVRLEYRDPETRCRLRDNAQIHISLIKIQIIGSCRLPNSV